MLRAEENLIHYVYPSWAELPYRWRDLPSILARPLESGYLDSNDLRYMEEGIFSRNAEPIALIDGPEGGGIIVAPHKRDPRNPYLVAPGCWLGEAVLSNNVDISGLRGTRASAQRLVVKVCYLEPRDDPVLRLAGMAKRPKLYVPSASIEHADSAGQDVYWMVEFLEGKQEIRGLNDVSTWAQHFQYHVERLDGMPTSLREETSSWFSNPSFRFAWFRVQSKDEGAGYQFAVMLYIALHLRKVAGRRMQSMHLVAQVEGRPNARKNWSRK